MTLQKQKHWRSKKYREFVARQPSILSGIIDRNVAHHHRKSSDGGIGIRPSDVYCVPLTWDEHVLVHSGQLSIDNETAFRVCLEMLRDYLVEKGNYI